MLGIKRHACYIGFRIRKHDRLLFDRYSLFGQKGTVRKRKPPAVDRNLDIVRISDRFRFGICIRLAFLKQVAHTFVESICRKLAGCSFLGTQRLVWQNVDQAVINRGHNSLVILRSRIKVGVVIIDHNAAFDRIVKCFDQRLQPRGTRNGLHVKIAVGTL